MIAVILAGGKGTRLWPMSREQRPKQFFDLVSEKSLLDDTYRRLLRLIPSENIFIATSPDLVPLVAAALPDFSTDRLIVEPARRDTAAAMGFAALRLEATFPNEPLVFVPSDHYIGDEEKFLRCLSVAEKLVRETGKLVDIGITPTFPNTSLGYTRIGSKIETYDGIDAFAFAGHTEKPSRAIAEIYLKDRSYLWHANYYMWTPAKFLGALEQFAPEIALGLKLKTEFALLPAISFDYAVTEKLSSDAVIILRGDFGWSDIGSWDTLHDRLSDEEGANVMKGSVVALDTKNSLVYLPPGKVAVTIGLDDIIIVDTPDALLVCRRDSAQRVKDAVEQLRKRGFDTGV